MKIRNILLGCAFCAAMLQNLPASAAELGHFAPAGPRARDFFVPAEKGFYYAQYNTYYTADKYKDRHGDTVDSVSVGPLTVNVDINVDTYAIAPVLMYSTGYHLLGATYAFYVSQPFSDLGLDAAITTNIDRGISSDDSSFGAGDAYVQPIWLGWEMGREEASFGYGVYIPNGKYEYGASDNIGLGYWSHQFEGAWAHYFDDHKMTALTGALTYEINQNKSGADIRPGQRVSFNAYIDHMVPLSNNFLGNFNLFGYGQWQVTDDDGVDATRTDVRDRVYGAGLEAGVTYLPWQGQASFKWAHEMGAVDRFEGNYLQLTLAIPF